MINESELRRAESTDVCEHCFGTGTKIDPVKGALPCPCRKTDRFRKLMAAARIPRRYARCSFANFVSAPGTSQDNALLHAHKFANEYPAVAPGLTLIGPAGVGKAPPAVAIVTDHTDQRYAHR